MSFVTLPRGQFDSLVAEVARLGEALALVTSVVEGLVPSEQHHDPAVAAFVSFRERAREAEQRVEVPWRTS